MWLNANASWVDMVKKILDQGALTRPRGLLCKEILCNTSVVDMTRPIVTRRPHLGYRFLAAEAWWIISGRNDVDSIAPYSPHISSFSDDGFHFDGAYGPAIITQLRYICDKILADRDTRQAVIGIWKINPRDSRDGSCTISLQFMVRDNKLHCFDTMRSSDAWLGIPYDWFNFSMLSAYLLLMLRARGFPKNVGLGNLYLTAASQHLYVNPKADGATNIPYCLEDVQKALDDPKEKAYEPLDIDEFNSPQEFLRHLELSKDRKETGKRWLSELLAPKTA